MQARSDIARPASPTLASLSRRHYLVLLFFIALSYSTTTVLLLAVGAPVNLANQIIKFASVALVLLLLAMLLTQRLTYQTSLTPMLLFFMIYGLRLIFDVIGHGILMPFQTPVYVLGYFFGLTLLPVLLIALVGRHSDVQPAARVTLVFLVAANVALFAHSLLDADFSPDAAFSRRVEVIGLEEGTAVLNPLSFGILGAMLAAVLLGLYSTAKRIRPRLMLLGVVLFAIALGNVLFSASRGPALALASAMVLLLAAQARQLLLRHPGPLRARGAWLVLGLSAGLVALAVTQAETLLLIERVTSLFSERSSGGGGEEERDLIYQASWNDFLSSPVFGRSYVVSFEGQSPHNIVIEALMSTGLVGMPIFLVMLWRALVGLWRLMRGANGPLGVSFALVTVSQLAIGMTSASIGQTPELWIFLALVTVFSARPKSTPATAAAPAVADAAALRQRRASTAGGAR